MSGVRANPYWAALVTAAGAAGAAALLFASRWGIGVSYDSVFYLKAADNLLHGYGLSRLAGGGEVVPLTQFPPLYSLLLAAGGWALSASTSAVARWLAAALFGGLVVLSGLIVKKFTYSKWTGAAVSMLVLSSPVFFDADVWAMSEALYLICLLGTLWLMADEVARPGWRALLGAGLLTGAAYATRYVGAALLGTGLVVVWLAEGGAPWKRRLGRAAAYAAFGSLPALAWMVRNAFLTGVATNRVLIFHPIGRAKLSQAAHTLAGLVLPEALSAWLRLALMLALVAGIGVYWLVAWIRADRPALGAWDGASQLAAVLSLHGLAYAGLLVVSLSLLDASTPLDSRILSPLWLILILLAGLGAGRWFASSPRPSWGAWAAGGLALALVLSGGTRTWDEASAAHGQGLGFNSRGWVTSPTVAWVGALGANASITSNEAFPLYYLTGQPVYWAPEAVDPVKGEPRADLPQALSAMRARLKAPNAYLIIFHPDHLRVEMPPLEELTQGLRQVLKTTDAVIYTGP